MTTPRENLMRSLRREGYDDLPLHLYFCPAQIQAFRSRFGHEDYLGYFDVPIRPVLTGLRATFTDGRALFKREQLPADTWFNGFGIGFSSEAESIHMHHYHHPLEGDVTLGEVKQHPFPVIADNDLDRLTAEVAHWHRRGLAVNGALGMTIWERAWGIRSMDGLMTDMMDDDPKAEILLDRMTESSIQRTSDYARAGVDLIQLGDDIGTQHGPMMSLALWRKWLKPRLARVIDAARDIRADIPILYHSDGDIECFIDDLIEVGVTILNPVQPECMDFEQLHERYGDRLSFWGTIGTQTTMPFGSPDDVRAAVHDRVRVCGEEGGLVIGPTHLVEPEVPWENLVALRDAVADCRKR